MAQIGIDLPYQGNEIWVIPNTAQATGFQTFLQQFSTSATRSNTLAQADYVDSKGGKKNIIAYLSRDSAKDLMAGAAGATLRTNTVGVSLHFGFDTASGNIVLIARSTNGQVARPAGTEFTNFNYLSKSTTDTNPNPMILDSEADALMAGFRANGYTFLTGLANGAALSVKFDNHVLARLLYADIGATPTISGQSAWHVVVAPPWTGDTGLYLSLVAQGTDAASQPCYRGLPPCPRYCFQG